MSVAKTGRAKEASTWLWLVVVVFALAASGVALLGIQNTYAKTIGQKNQQACDTCENVRDGVVPKYRDYSSTKAGNAGAHDDTVSSLSYVDGYATTLSQYQDVLGDGSVYAGGNARTDYNTSATPAADNDPIDFASVLPYGNVYVDVSKLSFAVTNSGNYIIDIQDDSNFAWVARDYDYTDANGNTPSKRIMNDQANGTNRNTSNTNNIAWVGGLTRYLADNNDASTHTADRVNIADAASGSYLYRITFLDAAVLPDGTRGNVQITTTRVEMESNIDVDAGVPVGIQGANSLAVNAGYCDFDSAQENPYVDTGTRYIPKTITVETANGAKTVNTTIGAKIDFEISVVDKEGNAVEGTISYACNDLDVEDRNNVWGNMETGAFAESLAVNSGAQSYAVVPYYDHGAATSLETGLVLSNLSTTREIIGNPENNTPLTVTGGGQNVDGRMVANGVRFSSSSLTKFRDANGTFDKALVTATGTVGAPNPRASENSVISWDWYNANRALLISLGFEDLPATTADEYNALGSRRIKANAVLRATNTINAARADNSTYDTGFAVLLDSKKSSMTWTGAGYANGVMGTQIFDSKAFVLVNQSHGTGGGIYLEGYSLSNSCEPTRYEGTVTMGYGTDATVTLVPEDGYRVKTVYVDGKRLEISEAGVTLPDGTVQAFASVTDFYTDSDGAVQSRTIPDGVRLAASSLGISGMDDLIVEKNSDGTFDITMKGITAAKDVHVDFSADYYFYKVWKGSKEPTSLNMTATPYAFKFQDVKIGGTVYKINSMPATVDGVTYSHTLTGGGKTCYVRDGALTVGEEPDVRVYYLEGNNFVHYTQSDPTDPSTRVKDETCPIRLDYVQNGSPVSFVVAKEDADSASETCVQVGTEDGYPIWKISYPAEGCTTESGETWPALPIETEPASHSTNHVERNYWFVTEEAPGWALVTYDNTKAEAPGKIEESKGRSEHLRQDGGAEISGWAAASTKDYSEAEKVIEGAADNDHVFMSVFNSDDDASYSWGGKITNVPALVVNAKKTWVDFSNDFDTRQDVWFHLDATISGTVYRDYLPPQKLPADGSGNAFTLTWGDKTAYGDSYLGELEDWSRVKVVGKASDVPHADAAGDPLYYIQDAADSHKYLPKLVNGWDDSGNLVYDDDPNGIIYYVNELGDKSSELAPISYSIRETDAEGNELDKADDTKYLLGYKSEVGAVTKDAEQATVGGAQVDSYTGELTNTLQTVDFSVTKVWKENGANRSHTLASDVAALKGAYTLQENGETAEDGNVLKLQPATAADYVAGTGAGTLEATTATSDGNTTTTLTWHGVPKYVGDVDDNGDPIVREAVYSVVESQLPGYNAPVHSNGSNALNQGTITNEVTPPTGTPKETYGAKNTSQTVDGKSMFAATTDKTTSGAANKIEKVELLDEGGNPVSRLEVAGGVYTIDSEGRITFTPDEDFTGTPPAVTVRGTDSNGLSATTIYIPHVVDNQKTVTRTITYKYSDGTPVLDGEGNPKTVVQSHIFTGTVDPDSGEVSYPGSPEGTLAEVPSGAIEGYAVDKDKVAEATVTPSSSDLFETVIYSPKGVNATSDQSYGLPGEAQTGAPSFEMETPIMPDGTPNVVEVKLVDPETGELVDSLVVPGQGSYVLNDDGTITFKPEDGYVGNPDPVEVVGTDRNGKAARTTYTPHVLDPILQDTASRTVHFRYLAEDGEEASSDVVQTLTLTRHAAKVDPKTGTVLEWGPWEPATFPAVSNPDDKVDGSVWTTDDSVGELEVSEPGAVEDAYVIYTKIPYTVTYADGAHGKSDGAGNQSSEDYGNYVSGGNGVIPDAGYKFTGRYTYVITDKDGKEIGKGVVDASELSKMEITGNIVFTPEYEKLPVYNITYDANGGTGQMDDDSYSSDEASMPDKDNSFTRKGYHYTGFLAYLTNGDTGEEVLLLDEKGEPILFTSVQDMAEYFKDMPNGTSIRMEAQWEPDSYRISYDANGGVGTMASQDFLGSDASANSKGNEFTREGYSFEGFTAKLPDGTTIKDANGNDMVFTTAADFMAYFYELGDGAEITLVAQWKPVEAPAPVPGPEPDLEPDPADDPEPAPSPAPVPAPKVSPAPSKAPVATPGKGVVHAGDALPIGAFVAVAGLACLAAALMVYAARRRMLARKPSGRHVR